MSVRWPSGRRAAGAGLLLLALAAMGGSLRNEWVQDDPPLIQHNAAVHDWRGLISGFTGPYWPAPSPGGLYRPLARAFHTVQWMVGGGALFPFRLVDLLLYFGLVLAVWGLAEALLPPREAWIAAALFAIHPVHVEAVAVAVNQGELVVGIAACLSAVLWLRWRRGQVEWWTANLGVAALLLVALGFKEHALVLPLLLGALELLWPVATGRRRRLFALGGHGLLATAWWAMRGVLMGSVAGAAPVEGLRGVGFGERALTMLGVAGEWVRLLLWPAHLQGDYSPWEIAPWDHWRSEQTAGALAVVSLALALGLSWRRRPVVAFGLLWVVIAIAPVSNLVIPTGILLAERTLLLASIGAMIAVAGAIPDRAWESSPGRIGLLAGVGILLLLGTLRSAVRMNVWRNPASTLAALRRDAPASWRTMVGAGIAEMESGDRVAGERLLRAADAAWPASPRPIEVLAFYQRLRGECEAALPLLDRALWMQPGDRWTRLPYVACLLDLGRYDEAARIARADTADDTNGRALRVAAGVADSAERSHLPPHTVRLAAVPGGLTLIGPLAPAARPR